MTDETQEQASNTRPILLGLYAVAFVLGVPFFAYTCVVEQSAIADAGSAYLSAIREGQLDAAYGQLSGATQRRVSRAAFASSMNTAEIARSSDEEWLNFRARSDGRGCLDGTVTVDGSRRDLDLYMFREGGQWTVHTVAYETADPTSIPWRCTATTGAADPE